MEFEKFPRIPRLSRRWCIITEKIDGTNGCVVVSPEGEVKAQSRNRFVTPGNDNYGFAGWVYKNAEKLAETLGQGRHYGEWYGVGIQRGYGMTERRFALFNARRWQPFFDEGGSADIPALDCVPILYEGPWVEENIDTVMMDLREHGSFSAPDFMNPEGIIVFDALAGQFYKKTFDDNHKGAQGVHSEG